METEDDPMLIKLRATTLRNEDLIR